jgi:hypothetical protein
MGSGLASLLNIQSLEQAGILATLVLSPVLWFSLRILWREFVKKRMKWYAIVYIIVMFQAAIAAFGWIWGFITLLFISEDISIFWAGIAGAIVLLSIFWILFYTKSKRNTVSSET